jgi:hypothetical protein
MVGKHGKDTVYFPNLNFLLGKETFSSLIIKIKIYFEISFIKLLHFYKLYTFPTLMLLFCLRHNLILIFIFFQQNHLNGISLLKQKKKEFHLRFYMKLFQLLIKKKKVSLFWNFLSSLFLRKKFDVMANQVLILLKKRKKKEREKIIIPCLVTNGASDLSWLPGVPSRSQLPCPSPCQQLQSTLTPCGEEVVELCLDT